MMYESKCPKCGGPVNIQVDDSYAEIGDPYGLKSLAKMIHCKKCVAFLKGSKRVKDQITWVVNVLRGENTEEIREKHLNNLRELLDGFLGVLNAYYECDPALNYEPSMAEELAANPEHLSAVLRNMEQTAKLAPKQSKLL